MLAIFGLDFTYILDKNNKMIGKDRIKERPKINPQAHQNTKGHRRLRQHGARIRKKRHKHSRYVQCALADKYITHSTTLSCRLREPYPRWSGSRPVAPTRVRCARHSLSLVFCFIHIHHAFGRMDGEDSALLFRYNC